MPLLEKVEHRNSGMEGFTDKGKWVPLEAPTPCALLFEASQEYVPKELKELSSRDKFGYYQFLDVPNEPRINCDMRVLAYIFWQKRKKR